MIARSKTVTTRKFLTRKQYNVMSLIDKLHTRFGKFPTYEYLANFYKTSKQDIDLCISGLLRRSENIKFDNEEIEKFHSLLKNTKDGWVVYRLRIKNGKIIRQKVFYKDAKKRYVYEK